MSLKLIFCLLALFLADGARASPRVISVDIDGVVHPVTVEIVRHAIQQAQRENAELVLIRLNTPGGLMEAMRQTIEHIVASPVPVATYVAPSGGRAASAGFFLLLSADVAAMAPGTNTGAATPVMVGREMDPTLKKKVESDAAASLRAIADKRGRNAALAEKAVLESQSFTEKEALDNKLIELVANDTAHLLTQLDGREIVSFDGTKRTLRLTGATVADYQLTTREQFMKAISDPNIALVLLVLGALGVYIEFTSPGLIIPGVAGGIMVLLGLSALAVFPINWIGVALLVLALVLFFLEANFASGGILGVGGAVSMVLGAVLLIDSPIPEVQIRLGTALALAIPFTVITVFLLSLVIRARSAKVATGEQGMVGEVGVAHVALKPSGRVFVHGELWDAVSSSPVEEGARVRVIKVDGLRLKVEPE